MSNSDNQDNLPSKAESSEPKAEATQAKPAEPKAETKKPAPKKPAATKAEKSSSGGGFFLWLLVLLLLAAVAGGGYFGWQYWQQDKVQKAQLSELIGKQNQQLAQLQQDQQQVSTTLETGENGQQEALAALQAVQQRLDTHNKRLISLSSTSREDWLLAEAEYLLRLANQRLLTERATKGAQGLLETADAILMEMDDIDLFPIRQAIGQDIAALKLAPKVDRDGLFLRMAGLATQIEKLPTLPKRKPMAEKDLSVETPVLPEDVTWQHQAQAWATSVFNYLKGFVHIRRNQPVKALLPPEAQAYVKLNLRFMLERAQLAMLREEKVIYETSLQQARHWLQTQFPPNGQIEAFVDELNILEGKEVVAPLPDISSSLEQLRVFIERLHLSLISQPKAPATAKEA